MSRPTSDRPVGGTALSVVRVSRPQKRAWRAYASLPPKTVLLAAARERRRRLAAVPVAVTGSVGKSTTTHLLATAVSSLGPVAIAPYRNRARGLIEAVRSADSDTRFIVQEIGASGPGSLDELLWTLEPRVGVITAVRPEHTNTFASLDEIAREKRKLVAVLPHDGTAVLNADDPRVRAMADAHAGAVVLAGRAEDADVRLLDERQTASHRYGATISIAGRTLDLQTRLVGTHWGPAVALALGAAVALGAEPERAAAAIAAAEPARERLEPMLMPSGATLLIDTRKATPATLPPAFEALTALPATRRIVVLGSLRYFDAPIQETYGHALAAALAVADRVIVYEPTAHELVAGLEDAERVTATTSIAEVARWIREETGPGDVVLVKGCYSIDHLHRVALQFTHGVQCWTDSCRLRTNCIRCRRLGPPLR